jgi:hypothetical protein
LAPQVNEIHTFYSTAWHAKASFFHRFGPSFS